MNPYSTNDDLTPDQPIVVNCIGAGRWGPNIARAFENLPNTTVHYVCDTNDEALTRIRSNMSRVETTSDVTEAIEDPRAHAIAIATPVSTHFELAKAALEACTRYLSLELGEHGIRVNTISAGPLRTLSSMAVGGIDEIFDWVSKKAPLRRNIEAGEVGKTAVYLASDLSSGVTGENIFVDAGYNIVGL